MIKGFGAALISGMICGSAWLTPIAVYAAPGSEAENIAQSAKAPDADTQATQALITVLGQMNRFEADFAQFTQDAEGTVLQEVRGKVHLARPQRFYWHIQSPYHQKLVVRDQQLWIVDDDLEQVTVQGLSNQVGLTPAILLSGNPAEIQKHYTVAQQALPGEAQKFVLRPRAESGLFEQLNVVFDAGQLKEMDFRDTLGQRTAINFTQARLNQHFDDDIFTVAIPEGYDVIEDL